MKLLFVTPEYLPDSGGGIITFYQFLLPEMVRQGHDVTVIVADGRHIGAADRVIDGVHVCYLGASAHGRWLEQFARYTVVFPWLKENLALAWAAWEAANAGEGWDHVEVTEWPMIFVPWVLNRHRAPCTVQLHGSHGQITLGDGTGAPDFDDAWMRLIERAVLREASAVQTNSHLNGSVWEQRLGRHVSVEAPAFAVKNAPAVGAGTLRRPLVGRVFGRFNLGKGAFALADSLAGEAGKLATVEWHGHDNSYGTTSVSSALCERFPAAMDRSLRHLPAISHAEVLDKMTDGSFVLVPTLCDVFNLTVAEAMAMRAVVICSCHAGARDLIEDGVNGFLYDPLAPADLARVLRKLESLSPDEVIAITDRGAETVSTKLDPKTSVERRVKFYNDLAAAPRSEPLSDWLGEALSGSPAANEPGAFLDRVGLNELSAAMLRRVPGFSAKS